MTASLSFRPNMLLVLSPFVDRTGPPNPLLNRTQFSGLSAHRPFIRGSLSVAKFGFKPGFFPDPDASEGVVKELFTRAESLFYTIADAAVSSSDTITTTTAATKQSNDWLSGIAGSMEAILKVILKNICIFFLLFPSLYFQGSGNELLSFGLKFFFSGFKRWVIDFACSLLLWFCYYTSDRAC